MYLIESFEFIEELEIEALYEDKEDDQYYLITGKRKNSIARVWLKRGTGEIKINGKPLDTYFSRPVLQMIVNQPLDVVKADNSYEIMASVKGGGLSGQAGAVRLGISKALVLVDPENRPALKANGLLTRDSRKVERKKPGQPGARKKFQFSKR